MPLINIGPCKTTGAPIELFYDSFGSPSDEPILLIMGLGTQMIAWSEKFCKGLVHLGYYVVRYDNRDVGLSSHLDTLPSPNVVMNFVKNFMGMRSAWVYTLGDMARDAISLLDALHIPAAHLVGASMGGMIAQVIALEHPTRVKSMCCIMSSTGERHLPGAWPAAIFQLAKPLPRDHDGKIAHSVQTLRAISSPVHFDESHSKAYAVAAAQRSTYRGGFPRQTAAILAAPGRSKALGALTIPTLVIHGKLDPLLPFEHGAQLHRCMPGSAMLALDTMAHDLPESLFPAMFAAIDKNCRSPPPSQQGEAFTRSKSVERTMSAKISMSVRDVAILRDSHRAP